MNELSEAIAQAVMMTWDSVVRTSIRSASATDAPGAESRRLTGCIHLTGAEGGVITVECAATLANIAASRMFDLPLKAVRLADAEFALAELTNHIGANFRGLLPPGHQLSLPTVIEGKDFRARAIGTRVAAQAGFTCSGQHLVVAYFRESRRLHHLPPLHAVPLPRIT